MTAIIIIILLVAFIGLWLATESFWKALQCIIAIVAFHGLWWSFSWLLWAMRH